MFRKLATLLFLALAALPSTSSAAISSGPRDPGEGPRLPIPRPAPPIDVGGLCRDGALPVTVLGNLPATLALAGGATGGRSCFALETRWPGYLLVDAGADLAPASPDLRVFRCPAEPAAPIAEHSRPGPGAAILVAAPSGRWLACVGPRTTLRVAFDPGWTVDDNRQIEVEPDGLAEPAPDSGH